MKSPDARHMQRDLGNQTANLDFTTAAIPQATDRSTETAAQLERALQALRVGPKTTDELRALGIYQVSARIFGLRALGHSIKTDLFDGYAADGLKHARLGRYTLEAEASIRPVDGCPAAAKPPAAEEAKAAEQERFTRLAALFAAAGYGLVKAKKSDAAAPYYAARWGWLRPVRSLDDAEQLLERVMNFPWPSAAELPSAA
jgi:hypothetical protein